MSKHFPDIIRRSIWEAHGRRCTYCEEPLRFRELFIDHIIPQSLNDVPDKLAALLKLCGLPRDFDLHHPRNLVPCCHRCNKSKNALLFKPPRLMLILEITSSKLAKFEELRRIYDSENYADAARIALTIAFAKRAIPFEEAEKLLADIAAMQGRYSLDRDLKLADGTVLKVVYKDDVARLLDTPIEVNQGRESGLELVHDDGSKKLVRTCREYENALENGFYAYTNYAIKVSSDFEIPLAVFRAVERSSVPERTFIRQPRIGVNDLHLMPAKLAPVLFHGPDADTLVRTKNLGELVESGRLHLRRTGVGSIVLESEDAGCFYTELMRSDITGDGNEDILIFKYDYATQGTFGAGTTSILSRGSADAMFTWDTTTLGTVPKSG